MKTYLPLALLLLPGLSLAQAPTPAEVTPAPTAEVVVRPAETKVRVEVGRPRVLAAQTPTEVITVPAPPTAPGPQRSVVVYQEQPPAPVRDVADEIEELKYAARLYFLTHYKVRRRLILPGVCVRPRFVNDPALEIWERYLTEEVEERLERAQIQPQR